MSRSPRTARVITSITAAALLTTTVAGCSDSATSPVPVQPPVAPNAGLIGGLLGTVGGVVGGVVGTVGGVVGGVLGLVVCEQPREYKVQQRVGRLGGVISFGPHTLAIPAGALDSAVTITAIAPKGDNVAAQFYPHGLKFKQPTALTMNYQQCGLKAGTLTQVVYVDDSGNVLEQLPSITDTRYQRVVGSLSHFSSYMIAYRGSPTGTTSTTTDGGLSPE